MKNNSKKTPPGRGRVIITIIVFILAAVLVIGALMSVPTAETASFGLLYKNDYILTSKKNVVLNQGDFIEVDMFYGEGEIDVEIYAIKNTNRNLTFTYAGKEFKWNDTSSIANSPVTRCFDLDVVQAEDGENGFVRYNAGDEYDVIEARVGSDAFEITNGAGVAGDLFRMDVTVGTSTVSVYFSCQIEVKDIELDQSQIIF